MLLLPLLLLPRLLSSLLLSLLLLLLFPTEGGVLRRKCVNGGGQRAKESVCRFSGARPGGTAYRERLQI